MSQRERNMKIEDRLKNIRTIWLEKRYSKAADEKGFETDRKIVVFESDDWGSIRMPSTEVYEQMKRIDPKTDHHPFFRYDSLAGSKDLELLFEVLHAYHDKNGASAVITANCAMANPDFEAIRKSSFETYAFEPFTKTLEKTPGCEHSFALWEEGRKDHIFVPQLHCREHFNVKRWMQALKAGDRLVREAFDHGMISTASCKCEENENTYMDSFNYDTPEEVPELAKILTDAAELFKETFGSNSESFIASCYIWGSELEEVMAENGIRYIQGEPIQRVPSQTAGTANMQTIRHYMGDRNHLGQYYLIRNGNFEPSFNPNKDWVDIAMNGIKIAFANKKPAVICTHRLNYIGRIDARNRDRNLKMMQELLKRITDTWPDVEFMSSAELGSMIEAEKAKECV